MRAPLLLIVLLTGCVASAPSGPVPVASHARLTEAEHHAQEPHIAVRDDLVVVAAQELVLDALTGAERMLIHVHRSTDGGATWTRAPLPQGAILADVDPAGRLRDSGDAVLAFAPDGGLYLAGVAASPVAVAPGVSTLADLTVFLARSDDGGATWGRALYHADGVGPAIGVSADKPWVVVSPEGDVHLVHTRFLAPVTLVRLATSTDDGRTWTERTVARGDVADLGQLNGATLAAPGGGRLYLSVMDVHPLADEASGTRTRQLVTSSADGGATWSAPVTAASAVFPRYGAILAGPADPLTAHVAVSDEHDRMVLRTTTDGGATWGPPTLLAGARGPGQQLPSGYVDAEGRAHLAFYDASWPNGERVTLVTIVDGVVASEVAAPGPALAPGLDRREYLGAAGDATTAWSAWVGGDEAAGRTFIDVASFVLG